MQVAQVVIGWWVPLCCSTFVLHISSSESLEFVVVAAKILPQNTHTLSRMKAETKQEVCVGEEEGTWPEVSRGGGSKD